MKAVEDVINILIKVKDGILKFYIENGYIYCENTKNQERVVVGTTGKKRRDKMFEVCIKSDYAVLNTKDHLFYYGYEFDRKECECGESMDIWGFEVTKGDNTIYRINADEMKKKINKNVDTGNCAEMLILGIGLWLDGGFNENN